MILMKFKTAVTLVAALLCFAACNRPPTHFTVKGVVTDTLSRVPGSMVYLIGADGPIDSTAVKNNSFTFKGDIDKTKQLVVILHFPGRDKYDDRFLASFVPDAERIGIDLDYPATVTGSPITDAIGKYTEATMNLYYEHETDIGSLTMNGDIRAADSIYQAQLAKIDQLSRETYLANTDNALGRQAITQLFDDLDAPELEELLSKGADFIRNDEALLAILKVKKNAWATSAGAPFIEIVGATADGNPTALSDFAGKGNYVLADFWASWCGPCMMAIPTIREMRDRYKAKGLVVVGINVWEHNPQDGPACAAREGMDWNLIFTSGNEATEAYGIEGIPTLILFTPDGKVAQRLLGEEGLEEMLSKFLD